MRRSRGALTLGAVVVLALAHAGCVRRADRRGTGFDPSASFARVLGARNACEAARQRLASPTDPAHADAARFGFEDAFRRYQSELARFLTLALNEAPRAPETRRALDLYARAAIEVAEQTITHDGDREAALRGLEDAQRYFEAVALQPPPELLATIAKVRSGPRPPARGIGPPGPSP
jgi:hypothetical protein